MKKFFGLILSIALALVLVACGKKTTAGSNSTTTNGGGNVTTTTNNENTPTTGGGSNVTTKEPTTVIEDELTLDKETMTVECYKTGAITATTNKETVTWVSSNPEVATVEDGVVTALTVGETTITATAGTKEATCVVTVTESTVEPVVGTNSSEITIAESGQQYTLTAETYWEGELFTEGVTYTWEIKDGSPADLVNLAADGASVVVTGLKAGNTTIVLTSLVRGKTASAEVEVEVTEESLSVELETNDKVVKSSAEGVNYETTVYMLDTENTWNTVTLIPTAQYGESTVTVTSAFAVANTELVSVVDGVVTALKAGSTVITATYTYTDATAGEKTATVKVAVTVERVSVKLNDTFTIETTNVQPLELANAVDGTVEAVTLNGKPVGTYADKVITLNAANLPQKVADGMGEGLTLGILTNTSSYEVTVNVYTKIIMTKADLDNMGTLAGNAANDKVANIPTTWDGYFVLGADIEYNGVYSSMFGIRNIWTSVGAFNAKDGQDYKRGFSGVFDGKGYNINGMTVTNNTANTGEAWGFIPVLRASGVIKNVSFTNAVADNTTFLCGLLSGTIENVMIDFAQMVTGGDSNVAGAVAGYSNTNVAKIKNCYFSALNAKITGTVAMVQMGNTWSYDYSCTNVLVVVPTLSQSTKEKATVAFAALSEIKSNEQVQAALATLDTEVWEVVNGLPIFKNLNSDIALAITSTVEQTYDVGSQFTLTVNKNFYTVTVTFADGSASQLTYANGKVSIPDGAQYAGDYLITVTDIYTDSTVTASFKVQYVKNTTIDMVVDFNFGTDGQAGISALTADLSEAAADLGTIKSVMVGENDITSFASLSGSTLTIALDVVNGGKMYGDMVVVVKSNLGAAEFTTTINALLVTKVIKTKADLDNMGAIAKAYSNDGGNTWDGYYLLGNDIAYNGLFPGMFGTASVWTAAGNINNMPVTARGFKGVFNGAGHTIVGLEITKNTTSGAGSGFIPTVMDSGVIMNVSFTHAKVTDSAYITTSPGDKATFKNIYVQYDYFKGTTSDTSTFAPNNNLTAVNASCIFVDCSQITAENFENSTGGWARTRIFDRASKFNNGNKCLGVFNDVFKTQESTHIATSVENFKAEGSEWQTNIKGWDLSYWDISSGLPIPKTLVTE